MKLITTFFGHLFVNQDDVQEFESVILTDKNVQAIGDHPVNRLWRFTYRLQKKCLRKTPLCRVIPRPFRAGHYFAILITLGQFPKCLPYFQYAKRKSIYIYDAWFSEHVKLRQLAERFRLDDIFFSSSQSAERFSTFWDRGSGRCHWVPEGINLDRYKYVDYAEKGIDVLQFGRKYDLYHEHIVNYLETQKKVYLYEKVKGEIVFPTREQFVDGLARAKISICVPSNITHPERSGNISMMTARYWQSMVSKCLIVGHKPLDMEKLFDYDPIIEIDMSDPVGQLDHILANYESYIPLIEKNYETLCRDHTWHKRWKTISSIING